MRAGGSVRPLQAAAVVSQFPGPCYEEAPGHSRAGQAADPRRDMENAMGLWEHVKALPDGLRAPVVLFYYEELPISEIADILALTPGAVKTRLSRARVLLRMRLEQEDAR